MKNANLLAQLKVVVTRPDGQNQDLSETLSALGATVITRPCIALEAYADDSNSALDLQQLDAVIFISANAVRFGYSKMQALVTPPQFFCVGSATANALYDQGVTAVTFPEHDFSSEGLLQLPDLQAVEGKQIVIVRGRGGRELLYETLQARGAIVHYLETYQRILPKCQYSAEGDIVFITSNEVADNLVHLTIEAEKQQLLQTQTIVGHENIAAHIKTLGFSKTPLVAANPRDDSMIKTLLNWVNTDD